MLKANEIFFWPGARTHAGRYPDVEKAIIAGDFPVLRELVDRPDGGDYYSGGIWTHAAEAVAALGEARRLRQLLLGADALRGIVFVGALEILLDASVATGNPVIVHYNGIGDGAWP